MFHWKHIGLGLLMALFVTLLMLFARGSSEIFIYNRF